MSDDLSQYIERLKGTVDMVEVARRLGLEAVGRGDRYRMTKCAFHEDRTPSMALFMESRWYHCFGCGEQGDVIDLVKRVRGCGFREAVAWLGGAMPEGEPVRLPARGHLPPPAEPELRRALELALKRYRDAADPRRLEHWAGRRGIPVKALRNAEVVAVDRDPLASQIDPHPDSRHVPLDREELDLLLEAGLLRRSSRDRGRRGDLRSGWLPLRERPYDFYRDRIIFPVRDLAGTLVGFTGRDDGPARTSPPPKYLSSLGFRRGTVLYGADRVRAVLSGPTRSQATSLGVFVVEGLMDALRLESLGLLGVAVLGASLTDDQVEILVALAREAGGALTVHLMLDADEAGRTGVRKAVHALLDRSVDPEVDLRVDVIDVAACAPRGEDPAKDPDGLLRGVTADEVSDRLQRGLFSPADALLAEHLVAPPGGLSDAWEQASRANRDQACGDLLRTVREHAHRDMWRVADGAAYHVWWEGRPNAKPVEWVTRLVGMLEPPAGARPAAAACGPGGRASVDPYVALKHAMRLGEASAHRREVPFDKGSWERMRLVQDAFLTPLAQHLRHLEPVHGRFAPLEPYSATRTPKAANKDRVKAMPGPEDLVLQQYLLLHLLQDHAGSGFDWFIPAVRYQVTRTDGPKVWTTGRGGGTRAGGDGKAQRVVSFAYQVDMDVLSGNRPPGTSGVFRHWYECWQHYRQEIQRQLRPMEGRVWAMSLDIRSFYDSVRWTDVRNRLHGPLRNALEALGEGGRAEFAPLFCGVVRSEDGTTADLADQVIDWFQHQASHYVCYSPADGSPVWNGADGVGLVQGPDLSAYLANVVLFGLDERMVELLDEIHDAKRTALYARYVDDMVIAATSRDDLLWLRDTVEAELGRLGLRLKPEKSEIFWGETAAEIAWRLDRDFVPSGVASEMPPVDGFDPWAENGPARSRREALQILRDPVLLESTDNDALKVQLRRAAQAPDLRSSDFSRLAESTWWLTCPTGEPRPEDMATVADEYIKHWLDIISGVEWAGDTESNNAAWTLRHYLTWLEGIDHALEKRGDYSPRLTDEASQTWERRQRWLAWAVAAGFIEALERAALGDSDRAEAKKDAMALLDHAIWLRRASILTSAQAIRQRPNGVGGAIGLTDWPAQPAIRRYKLTIAQDVEQRAVIADSLAVSGNRPPDAVLLLHEAVVLLSSRRPHDEADPLEPLSYLWKEGGAPKGSPGFVGTVFELLAAWRPDEGTSANEDPAQPWQLSAFLSAVGGDGFELIERRPRLWRCAFETLGAGVRPRLIPSPPGADVPALLGLAPADGPPHDVVAVEYVYDEDSRKRLESARPEELRDVEPTEPEANSRLSLLRKRQDVGPYLPNLDELGRQLDGDPDGQIAWLLAAFESLARTLPHVSRGEAVAVPTSGNLLVKPPGHADRPPELTGHVLGYRVPRDRVRGLAFVRSRHGGLRSVAVPGALADYWRIGVALADALGEWHGLGDGGLERLRAPGRSASGNLAADEWVARAMLHLCLVRLTGRGQVRNDHLPGGRIPRTIQRTLDHMRLWPTARPGTDGGASARMAHLLALHVAIAAAMHRSTGDPPASDQPGGAAMFLAEVGQASMPFEQALIQRIGEVLPVGAHRPGGPLRQTSEAWWGLATRFDAAGDALGIGPHDAAGIDPIFQELRLSAVGLRILAVNATLRAMVLERLGLLGEREELWRRLRREVVRVSEVWLPLGLGDSPLLLREPTRDRRRGAAQEVTGQAGDEHGVSAPGLGEPLLNLLALVAKATGVGAPNAEPDLHVVTPLGWLVLLALLEDPVLGRGEPVGVDALSAGVPSALAALAHDLGQVAPAETDDWPWLGAQALTGRWSAETAREHLSQLRRLDEQRGLVVEAAQGIHPPLERGEAETGEGMVRVVRPDGGTQRVQRWQVSIAGLAGDDRSRRPLSTETPDGRELYRWTVTWARSAQAGSQRLASVTYAQTGLAMAGGLKEAVEGDRAHEVARSTRQAAIEPARPEDLRSGDEVAPSIRPAAAEPAPRGDQPSAPPNADEPASQPIAADESGAVAGAPNGPAEAPGAFQLPKEVADAQRRSLSRRGELHRRPPGNTGTGPFFRSRLRVALLQWEVDDSYRHPVTEICLRRSVSDLVNPESLRKDPSRWDVKLSSDCDFELSSCAETRRRAFLETALDVCSALRVELLVLPEYSVRPETVDWLADRLGSHGSLRAILAGTYRVPTWSESVSRNGPGSAVLTLLHRERGSSGERVHRSDRLKLFAATALGELIRPTENSIQPLYQPADPHRADLLNYVCELVCAESFAATSPANLPGLADDLYRRYERFGLGPVPEPEEFFTRTVRTIAALGQQLSPENLMRRSIVLVPAMTTRTMDYALLGQTSYLAAGITTVLCSAAVRGFEHGGGSCFVGYDCWKEPQPELPGMSRPGPYHGALPGLWRHGVGGGLGAREQALVVADIDPLHAAERKTRGQGQAGPPMELIAHVPFIELPPARPPRGNKRTGNPCRCERAAWDAVEEVHLAPARDLRERLQKLAGKVRELLKDSANTTMEVGGGGGSTSEGAKPAGPDKHHGKADLEHRTESVLDALARLVPSSPALKDRAKAYREHHAASLQAWPPPALLDWAVVDPWGGGARPNGTGSGEGRSLRLHAPPFAGLSDDLLTELLRAHDQE